jgi:hypothetical protein
MGSRWRCSPARKTRRGGRNRRRAAGDGAWAAGSLQGQRRSSKLPVMETIGGAPALRVDARGGVSLLRLMATVAKSTMTTDGCPANGVWRLGVQAASLRRGMGRARARVG